MLDEESPFCQCSECDEPMLTLYVQNTDQYIIACKRCTLDPLCVIMDECGSCQLYENNANSTMYTCALCETYDVYDNSASCVLHYVNEHEVNEDYCEPATVTRSYQCAHCSLYFSSEAELQRHEDSHTELDEVETELRCFLCSENFPSARSLSLHKQLHANLHPCETCGRRFKFSSALRRHNLTHKGLTANSCRYCGDKFETTGELEKHVDNCEYNYESQADCSSDYQLPGNSADHFLPYSHTCLTCGKTFRLAWRYRLHLNASCTESDKLSEDSDRRCTICQRVFANPMNLHRHEMIHAGIRNYKCKICGKRFVQKTQLDTHLNMHRGVKPFICDVPGCKKKFTDRSTFHKHKRIHAKSTHHQCKDCGKVFSKAGHLHLHSKVHNRDASHIARVSTASASAGAGAGASAGAKLETVASAPTRYTVTIM